MSIKYYPFKVKKIKTLPVWFREGFDCEKYSYHVLGTGEDKDAYADQYHGATEIYGAGRAGVVDNLYVKGIGKTPLANAPDYFYATGELCLTDGIKEVVYLSLVNHFFPDSPRPHALMVLPHRAERNLSGCTRIGLDPSTFPESKVYDIACLLVRDFPVRYSHLFLSDHPLELLFSERPYLSTLPVEKMFMVLLDEVVRKQVILNTYRISTGYAVHDNIDIYGNIVDTTIFTVKRDFRNTFTESKHVLFWEQTYRYAANLKSLFEHNLFKREFDLNTTEFTDQIWVDESYRWFGLTPDENNHLKRQIPYEWEELRKGVISLIKQKANPEGSESWDCADALLYTPVIGVDPAQFFPSLLASPFNHATLGSLWARCAAQLDPADAKGRLRRCLLVNSDLTGELRNEPEFDKQITKALGGRLLDIGKLINSKLELIKTQFYLR